MSDLLHSVSQVRKSLQKKRLLRDKELSLNFTPLGLFDSDRSKTERNQRFQHRGEKSLHSEIGLTSPNGGKRFDFLDGLTSPTRVRSYKIDAANLLISRLKRFLIKHFFIWKKNIEVLRNEENNIFQQKAWRLKVSVGKPGAKIQEKIRKSNMAGKIVRKSQDNISKIIKKITSSFDIGSDDETPILDLEVSEKILHVEVKNDAEKKKFFLGPRKETAARTLLRVLQKKIKEILKEIGRKGNWKKALMELSDGVVRKRSRAVFEEILHKAPVRKSITKGDGKGSRTNFEGCLQNIRKFIDEKREKQTKRRSIDTSQFNEFLSKLPLLYRKSLLRQFFHILRPNNKENSVKAIFSLISAIQKAFIKVSFGCIRFYPSALKNNQRTLKLLMKNLHKDFVYRMKTCFRCWKSETIINLKQKELNSLSTATIYNILSSLINCRAKVFFSTSKFAMNKFREISKEKYKNILKAANRLSLFIRDLKFKPFTRWKYAARTYKGKVLGKKQVFFRLERNLMLAACQNLQNAFAAILIYAKQKQAAVRLMNKFFKNSFHEVFAFFQEKVLKKPQANKASEGIPRVIPRKFTYKYLCGALNKLGNNLSFHHNALKKNTMKKWRFHSLKANRLERITIKYNQDVNRTLACSLLFKSIDMGVLTSIRFSFIKMLKF